MVANLNHVNTRGGNVEAQGRAVVLLGGKHTSSHVVEHHDITLESLFSSSYYRVGFYRFFVFVII